MNNLEYDQHLKHLRESCSSFVFPNSGIEHAEILMSNIFDATRREISILSGALSETLTNRSKYVESFKKMMERGVKIKVILVAQNSTKEKSEAHKLLEKYENAEIKILDADTKHIYEAIFQNKEVHFCFSDEMIFRLEYDTREYKAYGSFNNREIECNLIKAFDLLFNKVAA